MSEMLRAAEPAIAPDAPGLPIETRPLEVPAEDNDNEPAPRHRSGEAIGFEIPSAIWAAMIGCYAIFLGALLAATGGAHASFAIAIAAVYVAMFFGTARALLRQGPAQPRSPLSRSGGKLATLYGPLGIGEAAGQMLVVPGLIACFAISIVVFRAWVL